MAHYDLDELEADEIFHALVGRKGDLDSRVKSLGEKDGLPEAAEAVRKRIELYMPSGEGDAKRVGLIRLFAPQRDLEDERENARAEQERDPSGGQDLFGGGAETGGGTPAGGRGKAKRGKGATNNGATNNGADAAPSQETPDTPSLTDPVAQAIADPIALALEQLAGLAIDLLAGDVKVEPEIFRGYAIPVLDLLPKANDAIDRDVMTAMVNGDLAGMEDNAHALAHFIQRNVDAIREAREKPIGRREEAHDASASPSEIQGESSENPDQTLEDVNVAEEQSAVPAASNMTEVASDVGAARGDLSFASPKEPESPTRGARGKRKT